MATTKSYRPAAVTLGLTGLAWLPLLLWYLAFTPGIMTADSLNVWHQAISGTDRWVDWHPPLNMVAMRVSDVLTNGPALVTLAQSLLLAGGIVAVARAAVRAGASRRVVIAVTAVVVLSPMVGAFSVSVWKDVPFTACVLFVGARMIDLTRALAGRDEDATSRAVRGVVGWGLVSALVRQNGFFLTILLLLVLFLLFPALRRRVLVGFLVIVAVLGTLKLAVYPVFGIQDASPRYTLSSVLHDLASASVRDPGFLDRGDRALMGRAAPTEEWSAGYRAFQCTSADWQSGHQFDWDELSGKEGRYVGLWLRLLRENPRMVLGNRLCLASLAWRPDPVGRQYTVSRDTDPNQWGLAVRPISGGLHDVGLDLIDLVDGRGVRWLLWRAPLWIYAAYAAFGVVAFKRRRWLHLLPLLPLACQQVTLMLLAPTQDARFMMPGLLLAVLLLPLATAHYADQPSDPEPASGLDRRSGEDVPVAHGPAPA